MKKILLSILIMFGLGANAQFWTAKSTGFTTTSRGIASMSIVDANNVWVAANDGTAANSQVVKEISKTTDGGNTWTPITPSLGLSASGLGITSISAVSATTAWITLNVGTSGIGGVWKTTNSGTSFSQQTTAAYSSSSFVNFVHFFDANNGVTQGDPVGGYFEIYTTSNGGTTWTRVPSVNIPVPLANDEYGYTDNFFTFGSTIWFGTSSGRLYKSSDFGLTWTVSQTPLTDFGSTASSGSVAFSSATNGLLVTSAGTLYSTSNGGTTFTPVVTTGFYSGDIAYVPGTTGTFVTTGTLGSSYTLNNGVSWTAIDAVQKTKVAFFNNTVGFAGGFTTSPTAGGIFKYTGTQLLKADAFTVNKFSAYPNPVNDIVTVTNSENATFNEISITDINGRTVKTVNAGNVSELQINISELNAGIYFMNISSENGKAVKKFIKN